MSDQINDAYGTCNTATWNAFLAFDKRHRCGVPDLSDDHDLMEWRAFEAGASFGAQHAATQSPWMTKAEVCAYFRRPEKWVDFWCHPDRNSGAIPAMPRIGAVSNQGGGKSTTPSFYAPDVAEYLLKYHKTPKP